MAYVSNIKEVTKRLVKKLEAIQKDEKTLGIIATTILASNTRRIHLEGKNINGGLIGQYSTTPLYISSSASPKKFGAPTGKTGKSKFRSGKAHTSKYFAEGYAGFRNAVGRDASKVNLTLTSKLQNEFIAQRLGKGYVLGFTSSYGSDLRRAFETKYGARIWGVTRQDRALANKIALNAIKKRLA